MAEETERKSKRNPSAQRPRTKEGPARVVRARVTLKPSPSTGDSASDDARRARILQAAEQLGIPVAELRDALLQYHLSNGRVRLVSGHFRWRPELREQFPDVVFLTLLREPVAHFLSSYFFQREERGQRNPITEDLATHLQSERALSAATRFVTFFGGADTPAGAVAPAAIARARHELARLDLVGVLEDLPAFTAAYERRFDRALHIPHAHRGNLRPKAEREEVTPELRARIEELVAPNRAVYDFVRAGMASPPR